MRQLCVKRPNTNTPRDAQMGRATFAIYTTWALGMKITTAYETSNDFWNDTVCGFVLKIEPNVFLWQMCQTNAVLLIIVPPCADLAHNILKAFALHFQLFGQVSFFSLVPAHCNLSCGL